MLPALSAAPVSISLRHSSASGAANFQKSRRRWQQVVILAEKFAKWKLETGSRMHSIRAASRPAGQEKPFQFLPMHQPRRLGGPALHSLHHLHQNDAGRVQRRTAVGKGVEVLTPFLGQQETFRAPQRRDFLPEVDGLFVQADDAGRDVRRWSMFPISR